MIKEYNKKYWKCPFCKKGDLVEVSENLDYTAKTIYKVAYYDSDRNPNRILVEVDPEKNRIDLDVISGWEADKALSHADIEKYQIDFEKEYWWINFWNFKEAKIYFLKNE